MKIITYLAKKLKSISRVFFFIAPTKKKAKKKHILYMLTKKK